MTIRNQLGAPNVLATRLSDDPRARARRVLPGGYGRSAYAVGGGAPYALRGEGFHLYDDTGRTLVDLNNNFTALIHGHAHPMVAAAAKRAIDDGASYGLPNLAELDHAEALLHRLPEAQLVRYTNSGTEAVMIAIRLARARTGRSRIVLIQSAYHGTSDAVLPAGGARSSRGLPPSILAEALLVPLNSERDMIQTFERHSHEIAAVLIDLMPNRSGLISADQAFVDQVSQLCHLHKIVLVVDEVISFRLGWGGLAEAYGLIPDLTVLGKVIGGGFPVGAVAGRESLMRQLDPQNPTGLEHGGTFSANPVTMSAGLVAMNLLDKAAITRLNQFGDRARTTLGERLKPLGWTIRGRGSLLRAIPPGDAATQAARWRNLWWAAYERGLLLNPTGLMALSTAMDEAVIGQVIDGLSDAVEEIVSGCGESSNSGVLQEPLSEA